MSTASPRTGWPHLSEDVGDPYLTFLLYLLRTIPPHLREQWMSERLPKTACLLGLRADEWDVATRQVAM